ncbi:MAG: hypothetical protein Q9214_000098 [Letrouitia sp. 1 TL-2023]
MRPDFEVCANVFLNHSADIYSKYVYEGATSHILNSTSPVTISLQGCRELCGTGTAYYSWQDASNTITTWVLPIIGLLVQAPYESNQAWQTFLALCRWSGSPIAAMSYILWNIKITGKAALMVDMSTRYDEYPPPGSDFSAMRDSLYILCLMNQYTPKLSLPSIEADRLLRLTLFSNILPINGSFNKESLVKRRADLAQNFREGRKKGVVPVFISFLWFVFALALTVQLSFGDIGGNETAHNLALGLMVGWLPILILASTVDRNHVSADSIREKLNSLIDDVRVALLDSNVLEEYMRDTRTTIDDFSWMCCLHDKVFTEGEFFVDFGGQGRIHWHYGVAHPLLCGMETKFMAGYGRDWLRHAFAARLAIVVGSRNINGLRMFDPRMAWQITSSLIIVVGSVGGAFVLSYFTPTVGLSCRSGGYLIYFVIAVGLLVIELLVWWLTHERTHASPYYIPRIATKLKERFQPNHESSAVRHIHRFLSWFTTSTFRDIVRNFVLRPGEVANAIWLIYIIFAQTFGAYQTCDCMASNWGSIGGYIDFQTFVALTPKTWVPDIF